MKETMNVIDIADNHAILVPQVIVMIAGEEGIDLLFNGQFIGIG